MKSILRCFVFCGLIFLVIAGAASLYLGIKIEKIELQTEGLQYSRPKQKSRLQQLLDKFPDLTIQVRQSRPHKEGSVYEVSKLEIKPQHGGWVGIYADLWRLRSEPRCYNLGEQNKKIAIVLPMSGDSSVDPQNLISWYLVHNNFDALRVMGGNRKLLDKFAVNACADIACLERELRSAAYYMQLREAIYCQIADWLIKERGYENVFLVGVSLGAIEAGILAGSEQIKACVLILGGAGMAEIIMNSREPFVKNWREIFQQKLAAFKGAKNIKMEKMIEEAFLEIDPAFYAPDINPNKILMINARFDQSIPIENGLKLWTSLNRPKLITLPTGHISSAIYTPYLLWQITSFFEGKENISRSKLHRRRFANW